ncbi:Lysine--tRNA ligase [Geodia barretti]|uniref:Lysine--tRNA ligase n=1 Tax=Geodia barretti TaxID=519541 RepID=A0AA35R4Y3_GEOBA|nr:Lysine--tRNA ligase [Geodia barretti]
MTRVVGQTPVIEQRLQKLDAIRDLGIEPYPYRFEPTHYSVDVIASFDTLNASGEEVRVAGRLIVTRGHGKAAFADLRDAKGRLQIYVRLDNIGDDAFALWKLLDIGDFIGVSGRVFKTRTGQISVRVQTLALLTKAIRPLPVPKEEIRGGERVVHDQFSDKELRYRRRYLDLALNPDVQAVFRKRSAVVSAMREFLDARGFLEVETPVLQPLYGGASARAFVTHHNVLDMPLYLRISDELYLKRLIVGGLERAYADYSDMMAIAEALYAFVAEKVNGATTLEYQKREIDLTPPWPRIPMLDAIEKYGNIDVACSSDADLHAACKRFGSDIEPSAERGLLINELFEACVEPELIQPTFITDYPIAVSPLAKRHRTQKDLTERFEIFINGWEAGNAFSELNDPIDQRQRFAHQKTLRDRGDDEAQMLDEDFLLALEHGMPPTGGLGIGVDRLVMLLADAPSIRDAILFPHMRPKEGLDDHG